MAVDHAFAGPGKVFIREAREPKAKVRQQLVWGDWLQIVSRAHEGEGWLEVRGRGEVGWLPVAQVQSERLLEVNFIDVGQGDGAFMVTPDDEFAVVDAGESDNMRRFLSWRFNMKLDRRVERGEPHEVGRTVRFKFGAVSHPDLDHYEGFRKLLDSTGFRFDALYHSTLVERPAPSNTLRLGARQTVGNRTAVTELIETPEQLAALLAAHPTANTKYVTLLRAAAASGRVKRIVGVTREAGYLPGFGDAHRTAGGKRLSVEILGPAPIAAAGLCGLPWFGDLGKTKNGHSLVLRIRYGDVHILLGGDLNADAEEHLLATGVGPAPSASATPAERDDYWRRARAAFGADVAKACHHGSADFTTQFLRAVDAAATIVSSGDDEPHCHPRPDTLGALGRHGRGERPLIFSTELARSTREFTKPLAAVQTQINAAVRALEQATTTAEKARIRKEIDQLLDRKERNVAVYGMISVRTDGRTVVIAQKLERDRAQTGEGFDLQWLAPGADGRLASAPSP